MLTLVAVLAVPLGADIHAIHDHVTDAGYVGALPSEEQRLVSSYLRAHQGSARYEVAAESATQIGSLIVQDARPIIVLTTYNGARVHDRRPSCSALIAAGQGPLRVPELVLRAAWRSRRTRPARRRRCGSARTAPTSRARPASAQAGVLYLLPGASA